MRQIETRSKHGCARPRQDPPYPAVWRGSTLWGMRGWLDIWRLNRGWPTCWIAFSARWMVARWLDWRRINSSPLMRCIVRELGCRNGRYRRHGKGHRYRSRLCMVLSLVSGKIPVGERGFLNSGPVGTREAERFCMTLHQCPAIRSRWIWRNGDTIVMMRTCHRSTSRWLRIP